MQSSLFDAKPKLAAQGWDYPIVDQGKSQNASVLALAKRGWGWVKRGSQILPMSRWNTLVSKVKKSRLNSILSSEFFSELSSAEVRKVGEAFEGFNVQVVFTMRPLDKIFPSTYQQGLKSGGKRTYEEWLELVLADYASAQRTAFWGRNRYAQVLNRWIEVFGSENVTLVTTDETNPAVMYSRMEQVASLAPGTLVASVSTGLNRSLLLDEIELVRQINLLIPRQRSWNEYLTFVRKGVTEPLSSVVADKSKPTDRLRTPAAFAARIAEIAKIELAELQMLDLRVIGSVGDLKTGSAPIGENRTPRSVSIEKMAKIVSGLHFGLLSSIAPRALFKNWLPYLDSRISKRAYAAVAAIAKRVS